MIQSSDVEEIRKQKNNFLKIKLESSEAVNWFYEDYVDEFRKDLQKSLYEIIEKDLQKSLNTINNADDSETENWTTGMWFWEQKHSREIAKVKTALVRDSLENLTSKIQNSIRKKIDEKNSDFKKNLYPQMLPILRKKASDENLNNHQIEKAVRNVVSLINTPQIYYKDSFPKELKKTGILKTGVFNLLSFVLK